MKKIAVFLMSVMAVGLAFVGCSKNEMKDTVENLTTETTNQVTTTSQTKDNGNNNGNKTSVLKKELSQPLTTSAVFDETINKDGKLTISNDKIEFVPNSGETTTIKMADVESVIVDLENDKDLEMDDKDEITFMTGTRNYEFKVPVGFGQKVIDNFNVTRD